jgi:ribosomal protein L7/L12
MKLSIELIEAFVNAMEPTEFTTLRFAVKDREERETKARTEKINTLKVDFAFTETEERLLSQRATIEVIKSIRHRLNCGLVEAKALYDTHKER